MDVSERLERLEDALLDLATVLTEGTIPWPSVLTVNEAEAASRRLAEFVKAVSHERGWDSEVTS